MIVIHGGGDAHPPAEGRVPQVSVQQNKTKLWAVFRGFVENIFCTWYKSSLLICNQSCLDSDPNSMIEFTMKMFSHT